MKKIRMFLVCLMVGAFLMSALVPMNVSAEATKPEWEEGQSWSFGFEKDLDSHMESSSNMGGGLIGSGSGIESFKYDLTGKIGFYQIYKVTEATDESYTLDIEAGGGLHLDGSFSVKGEFPKEGEYTVNLSDNQDIEESIPKEEMEMSGEGKLDIVLTVDGYAHLDRETMAMKDVQLEVSVEMNGFFEGKNIPSMGDDMMGASYSPYEDYQEYEVSYGYEDVDMNMGGSIQANLDMVFEDDLKMIDFPLIQDKKWQVDTNATVSGTYSGDIDISGLPSMIEENMDDENITFPMTLEDMDMEEDHMGDGKIEEHTKEIKLNAECNGTSEVELEDGSTSTAYVVEYTMDESGTSSEEEDYKEGYDEGYEDGQEDGENDSYGYDYDFDEYGAFYSGYTSGYSAGYYGWDYNDSYTSYDYGYEQEMALFELKYCPESGFMMPEGMSQGFTGDMTGGMNSEMDMLSSMAGVNEDDMTMKPISESEAHEKMDSITTMPEEDGGMISSIFSPMIMMILIGVIVIAVIVAIYGYSKSGKKDPDPHPPKPSEETEQYGQPDESHAEYHQGQDDRWGPLDEEPGKSYSGLEENEQVGEDGMLERGPRDL